jgi:hypothetical protein
MTANSAARILWLVWTELPPCSHLNITGFVYRVLISTIAIEYHIYISGVDIFTEVNIKSKLHWIYLPLEAYRCVGECRPLCDAPA